METKKVIAILECLKGTDNSLSFIAESKAEKQSLFAAIGFLISYVVLSFFNQTLAALLSALAALLFLAWHTSIGLIQSKDFLLNPVGEYIQGLQIGLKQEQELLFDLRGFTTNTLSKVKANLEFEVRRISTASAMMVGATEKLGLFPGFLALLFGVYKAGDEHEVISKLLLGFAIGLYIGAAQSRRVLAWLSRSIFVLEQAIDDAEKGISTTAERG